MIACPWCETIVDRGHCTSCARSLEPGWKICPWCRTTARETVAAARSGVRLPRLLVVGDDGAVHSLIRSAAGTAMDVDVAPTADDALTAVWDGDYDGVIVDQSLPGIGGVELLRLMRTGSRTAALPLMLVGEFDEQTGDSHVGGVDEVVALSASPIEMLTRLTLLTERSPHASAFNGTGARAGAANTDQPAPSDEKPAATNRRMRSVPVPSERRTRQSANRPKS
jgi:DNA-binding response OmpR family regulator